MINTNDLSEFGFIELEESAILLTEYVKNTSILDNGVKLELNRDSGKVFLVDENYNVAMMNGNKLEKFYSCPYCGHEGFKEDMQHEAEDIECLNYLKNNDIITEEEFKAKALLFEL